MRKSKYDLDVNHAGPLNAPCAILHAAKRGQSTAVLALMKSSSWGFRLGYHPISRRATDDPEKRTALHYLAMTGTPSAFCAVLLGARGKSSPTKVTTMKDKFGKTPLSYIIEHNRMDILKAILESTKGKKRGYVFSSDCYFDDIFGWQENDLAGYPDLELAKRMNPEMYDFICENLSADKRKAANIVNHVETKITSQLKRENEQTLSQAEEIAKFELSLLGESIYDDWTLMPEESSLNGKKLPLAQRESERREKRPQHFAIKHGTEPKKVKTLETQPQAEHKKAKVSESSKKTHL